MEVRSAIFTGWPVAMLLRAAIPTRQAKAPSRTLAHCLYGSFIPGKKKSDPLAMHPLRHGQTFRMESGYTHVFQNS